MAYKPRVGIAKITWREIVEPAANKCNYSASIMRMLWQLKIASSWQASLARERHSEAKFERYISSGAFASKASDKVNLYETVAQKAKCSCLSRALSPLMRNESRVALMMSLALSSQYDIGKAS